MTPSARDGIGVTSARLRCDRWVIRPDSEAAARPEGPAGSGLDGPGPARGQERGEVAGAPALVGLEELAGHGLAVLGALHGPEDADRGGLVRAAGQAAELEGQPGSSRRSSWTSRASSPTSATSTMRRRPSGSMTTPCCVVGAEADGLAVDERDQVVGPDVLAGDLLEGAVVEDVAVLVDLDERGALVVVGAPEDLLHVLAVHVVGAGHEAWPRRRGPG